MLELVLVMKKQWEMNTMPSHVQICVFVYAALYKTKLLMAAVWGPAEIQ